MKSLIQLENARVELGNRVILERVNWSLHAGAHAAIVGANGSGKSTFLRVIGGQLWPRPARSRAFGFGAAPTHTPLLARERIAHLSPEIQEKYVRQGLIGAEGERGWELTAREVVSSGWFDSALLHQTPDAAQLKRADQLLGQFDLQPLANRSYATLSQGQLRRVLLARALIKSPQVLLLDEACSGLDARARAALLEHIENLARSGQTTLVMATHRADELIPSIREVWEVREGTVARPSRAELAPASPRKSALVLQPKEDVRAAKTLIQLSNAAVTLDGNPIIAPLDWTWLVGQHFALTGPNGSGKSTFLRLLRGQIAPAWGGTIARFGSDKRRSLAAIGRDIALLSPHVQARFADEMPVENAIGSGLLDAYELWRPLTASEKSRVDEIISALELDDLRGRILGKLSYGQTRRVLLARALITAPKIVLLDEALDGLDAATRARTGELLGQMAVRGTHFAFASHHQSDFPDWLTDELKFPLAGQTAEFAENAQNHAEAAQNFGFGISDKSAQS